MLEELRAWPTAVEAGVSLRRPINPQVVAEPPVGFPKVNAAMYSDPQSLQQGLKGFGSRVHLSTDHTPYFDARSDKLGMSLPR